MSVVLHLTERQLCLPKVAAKKNQVKLSIHFIFAEKDSRDQNAGNLMANKMYKDRLIIVGAAPAKQSGKWAARIYNTSHEQTRASTSWAKQFSA
jgi:hypothetical protein